MRLVLASLAVALMVTASAFAQPPQDGQRDGQRGRGPGGFGGFGGGPSPIMTALDTDKDGELSTSEINAATASLKTLDKNKDGKIDREEQRPDPADGIVSFMMTRDENKDKKLSKEEAGERMAERFANIDANKDNQLDEAELKKYYSDPANRNFGGGQGRRPGGDGQRRPDGDGERRPGGDNNRPARPSGDVELYRDSLDRLNQSS